MSLVMPLLVVSAVPERERVRVRAAGELDLSTVGLLRDQVAELIDLGWRDLLVDLREVTFMDTSGVHLLLEADDRARSAAVRLGIVLEGGPVEDVLKITGVDRLLPLH